MPMEGGLPNYFTINGKAYPETETVRMTVGETLAGALHRHQQRVHPPDAHPRRPVPDRRDRRLPGAGEGQWSCKDTVNVGPGQRYDVIWEAREPGKWLLHCHIAHHTTNNNVEEEGGGGLMLIIEVAP